jgi:preprotein translocase subunit SecD
MVSRMLLPIFALMIWAAPASSEKNIAFSLVLPNGRVDVPMPSNLSVRAVQGADAANSYIEIALPKELAARFGQLSIEAVGQPIAIVVGCRTLSTPLLQSPILGGTLRVSCPPTIAECDEMFQAMRRGAPLCSTPS